MTALHELLETYIKDETVPGAVALLARGDDVEVEAVGSLDAEGLLRGSSPPSGATGGADFAERVVSSQTAEPLRRRDNVCEVRLGPQLTLGVGRALGGSSPA